MSTKQKLGRLGIGLIIVLAICIPMFAFISNWIPTWGATPEELSMTYPGDELLDNPIVSWTHGITINAPVEAVWPWVAQMGEERAAFYSYTFIENLISGRRSYINSNEIIPELQNPRPETAIINGMVYWKEIKPGEWILAEDKIPDMGWTWLWYLQPATENTTRMIVRMDIQVPEEVGSNPAVRGIISVGGFIMERNMMEGVRDRAEGRFEPLWIEYVEIVIWLVALVCGILAAIRFINQKSFLPPLGLGVAAVLALFYFTFGQPAIVIRVLVDALLIAGVMWLYWRKIES